MIKSTEKYIDLLIALVPLSVLIAPYSVYYLPKQEVIYPFAILIIVWFVANNIYISRAANQIKGAIILLICTLLLYGVVLLYNQQTPFVVPVIDLLFTVTVFLICGKKKEKIYNIFINIISILFALGIIEYLIAIVFKQSLMLGNLVRSTTQGDWGAIQGLFNIFPNYWENGYMRFQSLMDEPGRVGTLAIFGVISIDRGKYKYQYYILLLAGLLSFSLAFYLLFIVYNLFMFKINIARIILMSTVGLFIYWVFSDLFYSYISRRLEDGFVDNRTSSDFNLSFEKLFIDNDYILGLGNRAFYDQDWERGNAGVKVFIYQYGVVGVMLYLLPYIYMIISYRFLNKKTLILICIFLLSFYQRTDWNFIPNSFMFFMS